MRKKFLLTIIFIILLGNVVIAEGFESNFVKAEVIDVENQSYNESKNQIVRVKVLEGDYVNQEIDIEYFTIDYSEYNFELHRGSKVRIRISKNEHNKIEANIMNICREDHLKLLGIIFLIAVIIFGRMKGLLSVMSLGISGIIIIKIMMPMILKGCNPVIVAIICSILIILISFILIAGFTRKSFIAILGTVGGTIIAGILAQTFTNLCAITGLASEEVTFLIREVGMEIDFKGLFLSGVIIGSIGVVMDVAMTITSVIFELKSQSPRIGFIKLMHSGLEVGKDVMATMVNTLVLAYVGGSMPLFLMFYNFNMSLSQAVSKEIIATEIIRSLCGSIGLILTIPLTSFIASIMVEDK
ncbi:YibE/F family protein [Marinisporobacter balticus]|uniref:Putative membrane protein n=1 Tax=Marinisporobacter balticus TaxID=2018667 RepID=A0A4R2L3W6_9FIRM|nr:YibE/F family protein [Marinisporobacter balticus]TCO78649.1 putative membrane protein [Marinisporobacter balticus]